MPTRFAKGELVLRQESLSCVDLNEIQCAKVPSRGPGEGWPLTHPEAVPNSVPGAPIGLVYTSRRPVTNPKTLDNGFKLICILATHLSNQPMK